MAIKETCSNQTQKTKSAQQSIQTKQQIKLAIFYFAIATAQLLGPTFTVTHAAGVKHLSRAEAACLIPSVSSDPHRFGRATAEMRSQQLHSTFLTNQSFGENKSADSTQNLPNKVFTNLVCFPYVSARKPDQAGSYEIKIIFFSLVLTKGRSGGVHFLVPNRPRRFHPGPRVAPSGGLGGIRTCVFNLPIGPEGH